MEVGEILEKLKLVGEKFLQKTGKECYSIDIIKKGAEILDNKIGGKPYIPKGEDYPKDKNGNPLALLLQVNLADIELPNFPSSGILEIFVSSNFNTSSNLSSQIRLFEPNLEYETELPEIDTKNFICEGSYKISLAKEICTMPNSDYRFYEIVKPIFNEIFGTSYEDAFEISDFLSENGYDDYWEAEITKDGRIYQANIGGYADFTQSDPRLFEYEDKTECLFKIDNSLSYDYLFIGDSGIVFGLISEKDLREKNFENCLVDFDCC